MFKHYTQHFHHTSHFTSMIYELVSKRDLNEKMKLNENDEYYSVHITATGTLTDNPKSLAEMERTMHHREGDLRSVSSTADHPMDEKKICGTKRSYPPPDWPSGVSTT